MVLGVGCNPKARGQAGTASYSERSQFNWRLVYDWLRSVCMSRTPCRCRHNHQTIEYQHLAHEVTPKVTQPYIQWCYGAMAMLHMACALA